MANKWFDIFDNIESDKYTEIQKVIAINEVLKLETHNGVSKDKIIKAFRWFISSEEVRDCVEIEALQSENAELKELLKLAINELKRCADDNGGCYGCKNLDLAKDECICEEGKLLCNSVDNNMWQWQHADKLKELGVE